MVPSKFVQALIPKDKLSITIDQNQLNLMPSQHGLQITCTNPHTLTFTPRYCIFHFKDSTNPKTDTIPGYQGFIPQYRSESLYGKRMTDLSKDIFGDSNYGKKLTGLSSNGFNVKKEDLIDQSKGGSTSKYGRSSWLKAHPAWQVKNYLI